MRPYLQLLRPANVVTALADVLAGCAVAGVGGRSLGWLLAATAALYGGGVVFNDVFDRHLDATERPERPIPSGRVSVSAASALGGSLLTLGIVAAALTNSTAASVAAAIVVAVLLYDSWGKHQPLLGPVNMGLCRGLNLLLGMAAAPLAISEHWPLAGIAVMYIAAVTAVSRGEVFGGRRAVAGASLVLLTLVLFALAAISLHIPSTAARTMMASALTVALAWRILPPFAAAYREPSAATIRRAVRTGILSLVLLNAVLGTAYAGMIYGLAILATGLLAGWLARQFAVT